MAPRNIAAAANAGPMMPGPHPQVPITQAQIERQNLAHAHMVDMARRRARRPTDKTMPEGVEDVVIGDGVQRYRDLRDYERRLDAVMTRKRLDIVDSVNRNVKRTKTLRIWITNTADDQPWQASLPADTFDFSANNDATYTVKIEGRLLNDDDDNTPTTPTKKDDDTAASDRMDTDAPAKPKTPTAAQSQQHRLSHFFRSMAVVVDRGPAGPPQQQPEQIAEWRKPERPQSNNPQAAASAPAPAADFDAITFKRSGDDNVNVEVVLTRHEEPERFAVSPALAEVVDMREGTRQELVMRLWDYIRLMGLLEDEEKRNFRCDKLLQQVIGREMGHIPNLHDYISAHISPMPPIRLPYTIRVDKDFHSTSPPPATIYDVQVTIEDPLRARLFLPFAHNPEYVGMLKEVARLDEQLGLVVGAVGQSKSKHAFFGRMRSDPVGFMSGWLSSQKRDLEVILGESVRGGDLGADEWRRGGVGGVWGSEGARESVQVMLAKQPALPR